MTHVPTHTIYTLGEDGFSSYFGPYVLGPDLPSHAELEFSTTKVTVSSGESGTIDVTAEPPQGLDQTRYPYWSGFIVVNGTDGSSLSLPYQGLGGSLEDAIAIREDGTSLYLEDSRLNEPIPANRTLTLPAPGEIVDVGQISLPVIVGELQWGSERFFAHLVPMTTCPPNSIVTAHGVESIGQILTWPNYFAPRSSLYFIWYGQLEDGQYAPPGRYKIVFQVLRIFGNPSDEDDWLISETVPFVIEYADPTEA